MAALPLPAAVHAYIWTHNDTSWTQLSIGPSTPAELLHSSYNYSAEFPLLGLFTPQELRNWPEKTPTVTEIIFRENLFQVSIESLAHVLSDNMNGEEFITYTVGSHQGASQLHSDDVHLSIQDG